MSNKIKMITKKQLEKVRFLYRVMGYDISTDGLRYLKVNNEETLTYDQAKGIIKVFSHVVNNHAKKETDKLLAELNMSVVK